MVTGDNRLARHVQFRRNGAFIGENEKRLCRRDADCAIYNTNVRQTADTVGDNRLLLSVHGFGRDRRRFVGGVWCCFDENGVYTPARNGFIDDQDGTRYYRNDNYLTGWKQIEGDWYYFYVASGLMVTESRVIGGTWYQVAPDGKIAK